MILELYLELSYFLSQIYTVVEVFMENGVRGRARTAGANSRRDATKKHEISHNIFPINLHS